MNARIFHCRSGKSESCMFSPKLYEITRCHLKSHEKAATSPKTHYILKSPCFLGNFGSQGSNMFDSCSKLVAHVFCCDLSCLYSRSCAQTLGRRRCVVAQISASHRGMSSIGWRFARIPKQTHSYLTYLMNSLETSG